jgi:hypothetical protein
MEYRYAERGMNYLGLGQSARMQCWLRTIHSLGAAALLLADAPVVAREVAVALIVFSGWRTEWEHATRRSPRAITSVVLGAEGRLQFEERNGRRTFATINTGAVVARWLILCRLSTAGGTRSLVVMSDAVAAEPFWRLRRWILDSRVAPARPSTNQADAMRRNWQG